MPLPYPIVGSTKICGGFHAATTISDRLSFFRTSSGYHCSNLRRSVPSSVRVRVCNNKYAPFFVHRVNLFVDLTQFW